MVGHDDGAFPLPFSLGKPNHNNGHHHHANIFHNGDRAHRKVEDRAQTSTLNLGSANYCSNNANGREGHDRW